MFCPRCGQPIADSAAFCVNCGTALSAPNPRLADYQAQKNAIRQSELTALSNALRFFSQKKHLFQEYDWACSWLHHYSRGPSKVTLILGIIFTALSFLFLLPKSPAGFTAALFFLIPGLILFVVYMILKIHCVKKRSIFQDKFQNASEALLTCYQTYPDCPVGPEYINPVVLTVFSNCIRSGRADTIKESIHYTLNDPKLRPMHAYMLRLEAYTADIRAELPNPTLFLVADFFK